MKNRSIFILLMVISMPAFGQLKKEVSDLKPQVVPEIPLILMDSVFRKVDEVPTLAIFSHIEDYAIRQDSSIREMNQMIHRNLKYSSIAFCNVVGLVVIGFIIEKDGSMTNLHICKDIGHSAGEEAMRAVKLLPKFSPAMKDGKAVRFLYYVPVRFR